MNDLSYIYKITSPSGRTYIGQSKNIHKRFISYKNGGSPTQTRLRNSILKYGWENHKYELLECLVCDSDRLEELEIGWIAHFKCNFRRYPEAGGLNLTDGGRGAKGRFPSEETKNKISLSNTGKTASIETLLKISASSKGRVPWNKGLRGGYSKETLLKMSNAGKNRVVSQETRDKQRNSMLGKRMSEEFKKSQSIRMIGNKRSVGVIKSPETLLKLSIANKGKIIPQEMRERISKSLKGRPQPASLNVKRLKTLQNTIDNLEHKTAKLLLDTETGIYYYSIKEASRALNLSSQTLNKYLLGQLNNKTNLIYA